MPAKTIFEHVVEALKKELEPLGILVDADIYRTKLTLTDVLDPNRHTIWVMQVHTTGPHFREVEHSPDGIG